MQFPISNFDGITQNIEVSEGEVLFVAGKNGSGKSTLILGWARSRPEHPVLTGNREVSFNGSAVSQSPKQMQDHVGYGRSQVVQSNSRTSRSHHNDQNWLNTQISRLDAFGNHCMREENDAHRAGNAREAEIVQERDPIVQINQVFRSIGLGLTLSVDKNSNYLVTKGALPEVYGIDKMSDGERGAMILISTVILADQGQVITVDEPERHMHRSVSSPLLRELFRRRPDLIWIVATHDVALLRDFTDAKLLVLYDYNGASWKFDLLNSTHEIPDVVVDAIYGAREKVLFIEGKDEGSLDKPLYQVLFPETTIKTRGSCNEVLRSVEALNSVGALNSMQARGLVDADNRDDAAILQGKGVARLGVYAIESLYFHPSVVAAVAATLGKDADVAQLLDDACNKVSDENLQTFASHHVERALRTHFQSNLPKLATLKVSGGAHQIDIARFEAIAEGLLSEMKSAKTARKWQELAGLVKIKATSAPRHIIYALGLTENGYYAQARRMIAMNTDVRAVIFDLVPDPFR